VLRQFVTFCFDYPAKSWVSVVSGCVMLASHHRRHDCAARPADTRSNGPREGEPGYATSSPASDGFLHCRAAGECEGQRDYCEKLHWAPAPLIEFCQYEVGFWHSSDTRLGRIDRLLVSHTARGQGRQSYSNYKSERLHQHFPQRGNYLGQFLTDGESRSSA